MRASYALKSDERPDYALKADREYKDFIIRSITETFKPQEQSKTMYTLDEVLSVFRGDYYEREWFQTELNNLGYKRHLVEGPFKGQMIEKYKIELRKPFTGPIKIKDL